MRVIAVILGLGWLAVMGILAGAYLGNVEALVGAKDALVAYTGPISPVSIFGLITLLYLVFEWTVGSARRKKALEIIKADKPALANDPKALMRQLKVREKELALQKKEEKALKKENKAEKQELQASKKEDLLEKKRERIEAKKEELRERERLGRS